MTEKHRTPDRPTLRHLDTHRVDGGGEHGVYLVDPVGIVEGMVFVPDAILPIVARFDGAHTIAAIEAEIQEELGDSQELPADLVRGLVSQFDDALLLHGDRFRAALDAAVAEFAALELRPTAHAGSAGYPANPLDCRAALDAIVPSPPSAADTPTSSVDAAPCRGLVTPHIDLMRGSAGYAAAYRHLATDSAARDADLFVVFGTGHQGPSAAVTGLRADWDTPLGRLRTDRAFVDAVHARLGPPDPLDVFLHKREHSLEFQMLFLRHILAGRERDFAVAGFLTGSLPTDPGARDALVATFREVAADQGARSVVWIAGADLAHLGPFFGDPDPVDPSLLERLGTDERARLSRLEAGDPHAFFEQVEAHDNPDRVCGTAPIFLTAALAGGPARLLHYGQANAEDGSQVVSHCSAAF